MKANKFMLLQYRQRVTVEGQGEYEIVVNNLVNPHTMKSITYDNAFLNKPQVLAMQSQRKELLERVRHQ
jgi:hypothetical protein